MHWHERVVSWGRRHERVLDVVLALVLGTLGLLAARLVPTAGSETEADWLAYAVVVGAALTMLWRRSNPLVALPFCVLFVITYWVRDYPGDPDVILWFLFYAATRHGGSDRPRVWRVVGASLFVILVVATIGVIVPTEDLPFVAIIGIFFIHITAAAIGEALHQRSQYVSELELRAAALEADLETKTTLAAVEERTRIAREMHDIIAHGMSAIVVQAQGAQRLVDRDPEKVREVLTTIESIGRDSSDEMRRMLGVLREWSDDAELVPQPGFDDVDGLCRSATEGGVDAEIVMVGEPRPLPPGLELTGYRVVQEALTNVVRHAGRPAKATATITYTDTAVEIDVVDNGLGVAAASSTAGSGHGLLGMRERVEIYNGDFAAGPQAGGGYRVAVSLPIPARVSA